MDQPIDVLLNFPDALRAIADNMEGKGPEVQCRYPGNAEWHDYPPHVQTSAERRCSYRIKPKKIRTIPFCGSDYVAPELAAPRRGAVYYFADNLGNVLATHWTHDEADLARLAFGNVFLTRRDAELLSYIQRDHRLGRL